MRWTWDCQPMATSTLIIGTSSSNLPSYHHGPSRSPTRRPQPSRPSNTVPLSASSNASPISPTLVVIQASLSRPAQPVVHSLVGRRPPMSLLPRCRWRWPSRSCTPIRPVRGWGRRWPRWPSGISAQPRRPVTGSKERFQAMIFLHPRQMVSFELYGNNLILILSLPTYLLRR